MAERVPVEIEIDDVSIWWHDPDYVCIAPSYSYDHCEVKREDVPKIIEALQRYLNG